MPHSYKTMGFFNRFILDDKIFIYLFLCLQFPLVQCLLLYSSALSFIVSVLLFLLNTCNSFSHSASCLCSLEHSLLSQAFCSQCSIASSSVIITILNFEIICKFTKSAETECVLKFVDIKHIYSQKGMCVFIGEFFNNPIYISNPPAITSLNHCVS